MKASGGEGRDLKTARHRGSEVSIAVEEKLNNTPGKNFLKNKYCY